MELFIALSIATAIIIGAIVLNRRVPGTVVVVKHRDLAWKNADSTILAQPHPALLADPFFGPAYHRTIRQAIADGLDPNLASQLTHRAFHACRTNCGDG